MAIVKLTRDQIADIFKRIVGRDPTHNDYPAIVGLSNMENMTVPKIEEFFAPLKTFVIPAPAPAPVKVAVPVAPPVPAPVQVKLAPTVEPKPAVKTSAPVVTAPVSVPVKPITNPTTTAWDNDDKTPVDMPTVKKEPVHEKHVDSPAQKHLDKPMQSANIPGKKKGKK